MNTTEKTNEFENEYSLHLEIVHREYFHIDVSLINSFQHFSIDKQMLKEFFHIYLDQILSKQIKESFVPYQNKMENRIPTIDITGLFGQSSDEQDKIKISKLIGDACFQVGFFQIIGHGINQGLIHEMVNQVETFFKQSDEQKHRYAVQKWNPKNKNNSYRGYFPSSVNGKEGLDFSSPYLDENHQLVQQGIPFYQLNLYRMNSILIQYWDEMCMFLLSSFLLN